MFAGGRSVTSVTVFLSQSDATVKSLERGRSTCTKMLEQRGLGMRQGAKVRERLTSVPGQIYGPAPCSVEFRARVY